MDGEQKALVVVAVLIVVASCAWAVFEVTR
jgi:hypothetical protein